MFLVVDRQRGGDQADRRRLREVDALLASQTRQLAAAERLSQSGEADRLTVNTARALQLQATIGRLDALSQAQQSLGRLQDSAQYSLDEN